MSRRRISSPFQSRFRTLAESRIPTLAASKPATRSSSTEFYRLYEQGDLPINLPPVSNPSSSSKTFDCIKDSLTSKNIDIETASHIPSSDDRSFVVSPTIYSGVSRITSRGQHNPQKVEHSSSINLPGDSSTHDTRSVDINRAVTSAFSLHQKKSLVEGSANFFRNIPPGAKTKKKEKSVLHEISEETSNPATQVGDWSKESIHLQKFIPNSPILEIQQHTNESIPVSTYTSPILVSPRAQVTSPVLSGQLTEKGRQRISFHSPTETQPRVNKEPEITDIFQTPVTTRILPSQANTATSLAWDSGDLEPIVDNPDRIRNIHNKQEQIWISSVSIS